VRRAKVRGRSSLALVKLGLLALALALVLVLALLAGSQQPPPAAVEAADSAAAKAAAAGTESWIFGSSEAFRPGFLFYSFRAFVWKLRVKRRRV